MLEHQVRINRKDGSTKMPDITTAPASAGIDVSKRTLDVAITGSAERFNAPNDAAGHALIAEHLQALGVQRVGLEASGHYEAAVTQHLRRHRCVVAPLAEHLTLIEQLAEDIARLKTRLERYGEAASLRFLKAEIQRLTRCRARQLTRLIGRLRAAPDLARRLDVLLSIPGVGDITAVTFVIRMPELGRLIPNPIDQNPCAQSRRPMDMMRQG